MRDPIPFVARFPLHALRVLSLSALLLLVAAPRLAGQDYVGQIWSQLRQVETANPDYNPYNYLIGTLGESDTYSFTTDLDVGAGYIVSAVCDQDCSDVDLWIRDDAGKLIASDTAVDDRPIVVFTAPRNGKYAIQVRMHACAEEYCYFGFVILD